jgi:trigger factor
MQVSVEKGEGLERRMTVELPAEEISEAVDKRLREMAPKARLDGFRPGKVPMRILRARYGGHLQQEVFGELIESSYGPALEEARLRPAGPPSIRPHVKLGEDQPRYSYTAQFEVLPEIALASLADRTVTRPVATVEDADLEEMLGRLRRQQVTWNEVQRPAADGDRVMIDFVGRHQGEEFEGGKGSDVPLVLGSGAMIDGFESGLTGAAPGEVRTLDLTFPEGYRADHLAGQSVQFEVTVKTVAEPLLPDLDEAFVRTFGVADGSLEQLRADVRQNMERELRQRIRARVKTQVMDLLVAAHPIELPGVLVDREAEALRERTVQNMGRQNSSVQLPIKLFQDDARRRVTVGLLIAEIAKAQGIRPDPERVRQTIMELAATYENPEEFIEYYQKNSGRRSEVENLVLEEQVVDWVLTQVQVVDEPTSFQAATGAA